MDSHALLQEIFLTQRLNLGLLHCRQILYQLSYQGNKPSRYIRLAEKAASFFLASFYMFVICLLGASLVAQSVKCLPAVQETWV